MGSTGVKMTGEGEWKVKKDRAGYRRQRRKLHLGIDAESLKTRAIEIIDNRTGDAKTLPELPVADSSSGTAGLHDNGWCI